MSKQLCAFCGRESHHHCPGCDKPQWREAHRLMLVDSEYASRLAFALECLLLDYNGFWNTAAALLDEYRAAVETAAPSPPTFMGEPIDEARDPAAILCQPPPPTKESP